MKVPAPVLKLYIDVHSWVGIVTGLALFIAFYAGAITMFEPVLQQWASAPTRLAPAPPLEQTPRLIAKVLAAHPEAARTYEVHLVTDALNPARLTWNDGEVEEIGHGSGTTYYASFLPDGQLQVEASELSAVAQFIDDLHRQVGLMLDDAIAEPIMGAVALAYFVALVSGVIALLPTLVKDLFALRFGKNLKRMWLDLHNLLGVFSLPFHIVMALTSVAFAFHDYFYLAQGVAFGGGRPPAMTAPAAQASPPLPPLAIVERLQTEQPELRPYMLSYAKLPNGRAVVRAVSGDPDYGVRSPVHGVVTLDAASGQVLSVDFMPGRQDGWSAAVISFFQLHHGSFGGAPIRWAYFALGLGGALLFYTGNLLWIESRRKRERNSGHVQQTRSTRILGALTAGVPVGCIAGVSATLAAAPLAGASATVGMHGAIYHAVFLSCIGWALWRGAARAGSELTMTAAASMLAIPLASLSGVVRPPMLGVIDAVAVCLGGALFIVARSARFRARTSSRDSVWSEGARLQTQTVNPDVQIDRGRT